MVMEAENRTIHDWTEKVRTNTLGEKVVVLRVFLKLFPSQNSEGLNVCTYLRSNKLDPKIIFEVIRAAILTLFYL